MNPGREQTNETTLVHIVANGDNDQLHYIWDFTQRPGILVAQTERNASLIIDWPHLATHGTAVRFSQQPKYSMAFVLSKVCRLSAFRFYMQHPQSFIFH